MQNDNFSNFESFLNQAMKERGLTVRRLSELSGISPHHLELLEHGDFAHLPPAPYVHGFLVRLAPILEFDVNYWWERVKDQQEIARSGEGDTLPQNRFLKKSYKSYIFAGAGTIALLLYLGIRFTAIAGRPVITVTFPGEQTSEVKSDRMLFMGTLENGTSLSINGESVSFDADGRFQKEIALSPGLNTVTITAKKFLGRETSVIRQIFYTPAVSTSTSPISIPPTATSTFSSSTPTNTFR